MTSCGLGKRTAAQRRESRDRSAAKGSPDSVTKVPEPFEGRGNLSSALTTS